MAGSSERSGQTLDSLFTLLTRKYLKIYLSEKSAARQIITDYYYYFKVTVKNVLLSIIYYIHASVPASKPTAY